MVTTNSSLNGRKKITNTVYTYNSQERVSGGWLEVCWLDASHVVRACSRERRTNETSSASVLRQPVPFHARATFHARAAIRREANVVELNCVALSSKKKEFIHPSNPTNHVDAR